MSVWPAHRLRQATTVDRGAVRGQTIMVVMKPTVTLAEEVLASLGYQTRRIRRFATALSLSLAASAFGSPAVNGWRCAGYRLASSIHQIGPDIR
jgi:hypothetical protein